MDAQRVVLQVLVVDDEPIARQRVLRILARDPEVNVLAEVASVADLERRDPDLSPDLVLLDVQLPNHGGFELLRRLEARGVTPFVIFITAYSQYALDAFRVEAVDYILKPFDDERLRKAIARAKALLAARTQRTAMASGAAQGDAAAPASRRRDRLLVTENGRVLFVPTRDIELVQAAGKFVKIFVQGRCYLVREPLRDVEERLDVQQFVRVHRSTIINVEQILELHPLFHGDYEVVLRRGTVVTMSRRFRSRMLPFMVGAWPA